MLKRCLLTSIVLIFCANTFAQQTFKTSKGLQIILKNDGIYVNGKNLYPNKHDLLTDEPAQLIENNGTVFLFIKAEGGPNLERLFGFNIKENKIDSVVNAISSDIKNMDDDPYLEFGGVDLTESLPNSDSMYYIPADYYEIRDGKIRYDSTLTINMDIRTNGMYLPYDKDKMIPTPFSLTNIISERIDGPANIRDSAGGALLFSLNDSVAVITADTKSKWCEIALKPDQAKIEKGGTIFVKNKPVGKALKNITIEDGYLTGFTAIQNIRKNTIPEEVLTNIIRYRTANLDELKDYLQGYQFTKSTRCGYTSYFLNEGPMYGPSAPMRLELLFDKNKLFGVIHNRTLPVKELDVYDLDRGFYLTVPNYQPSKKVMDFIKNFNEVMKIAD